MKYRPVRAKREPTIYIFSITDGKVLIYGLPSVFMGGIAELLHLWADEFAEISVLAVPCVLFSFSSPQQRDEAAGDL